MLADFPRVRALVRDFIESMARLVIGEPARIVPKSELERLERLAYREVLRNASEEGDFNFIEQEIRNNQLTAGERRRLARKHTPLNDWPDTGSDIVASGLFDDTRQPYASAPQ